MRSSQKISTKKNAFIKPVDPPESNTSAINKADEPHLNTEHDKKEHYYGAIKKTSCINDITYLCRGSVYYLRDNPSDPNTTYHPYLVIQAQYLDKIGKITVFGITSTPSSINMVPVVIKGNIGYIDPHEPYRYRVSEFFEPSTRYIGSVVNSDALDIAVNLYGLYLGMNLNKTEEDIINDYLRYVDDFKIRTKGLKPYKHKVMSNNYLDSLELKTSFIKDPTPEITEFTDDIYKNDIEDTRDLYDVQVFEDNVPYGTDQGGEDDNDDELGEKAEQKPILEVDLNSDNVLDLLSDLETRPAGEVKLPRRIKDMTDTEKEVFLASIFYNGHAQTASLYNCSFKTVGNKERQITAEYQVIYKDIQ